MSSLVFTTIAKFDLVVNKAIILEEVVEKYGYLNVVTFKKLLRNRLIMLTPLNDMIYRKIIEIFHRNFEKKVFFVEADKLHSEEKLKKFISCLPSFVSILKVVNKSSFNLDKRRNVHTFYS